MTADQWYIEIVKVLDPTDPKGTRAAIAEIVGRIQLAESERAAGVLRETAKSDEVTSMCCSDDTGNLLDALAAEILRTSPGKGGE